MPSQAPLPLTGASCLIWGAGGLGRAIAFELAERDARVTLAARRPPESVQAVPGVKLVTADVLQPPGRERAFAAAEEHGGGLDCVVCAVGAVAFGRAAELDEGIARELLEVNVLGPVMLASEAQMRVRSGGVIANISGGIAEQNLAGMALYGATKAALLSFDRSFAREARRSGIRVLDIRPPHTETGLASRALAGEAPALGEGLEPRRVARVICDALESGERDLPPLAFDAP